MKLTIIQCDICGEGYFCKNGMMEIRVVRQIHVMAINEKRRQKIHICPFCQERIRELVLGEEKPVDVDDVMRVSADEEVSP